MRITFKREIELPRPINYLRLVGAKDSDPGIDVADVSDEELRTIGLAMVDALIENARSRRVKEAPMPQVVAR